MYLPLGCGKKKLMLSDNVRTAVFGWFFNILMFRLALPFSKIDHFRCLLDSIPPKKKTTTGQSSRDGSPCDGWNLPILTKSSAFAQGLLHLATSSVKDCEEDAQEDLEMGRWHQLSIRPQKKNEKRGKVMYQNASLLCCIRFYFSPVDPVSFRGRVKRTMFSSIYYQDSSKTGGAMEHRHASSLQNIVTVSSSQVSAGTWTDLRHVLRLRKPNNQRIR